MARIRKLVESKAVKTQIVWKIGKYIRLSRDDGNIVSESVVNQDKILNDEIPGFFREMSAKCYSSLSFSKSSA